jgi:hypothetical protein
VFEVTHGWFVVFGLGQKGAQTRGDPRECKRCGILKKLFFEEEFHPLMPALPLMTAFDFAEVILG